MDVARLIDSARQAVVATDANGTLTYWNRFAEMLYGWSADEVMGRHLVEMTCVEAESQHARQILRRVHDGAPWIGQLRARQRSGQEIGTFALRAPLFEEGRVIGIFGVSVEASAVADLSSGVDQQHREVLYTAPDPLFRISADGRFLAYAGPVGSPLLLPPEEFTGRLMEEVMPADVAARCREAIAHALGEQTVVTVEYELEIAGGIHAFEARIAPAGTSEVIAIVRDITESRRFQNELYAHVTDRTREIAALSERLLAIQDEERRRIGRELHDDIGQMVTALSLLIAAARKSPAAAVEQLVEANGLVLRLQEQVRDLSFSLARGFGGRLSDALRAHAAAFSHHAGLPIDVTGDAVEGLSADVEATAFRIVQEALTNVIRHARASAATVAVSTTPEVLRIAISDDGCGFDPTRPVYGLGLAGMRERARLAGGRLIVESVPGGGTTIVATLPRTTRDKAAD